MLCCFDGDKPLRIFTDKVSYVFYIVLDKSDIYRWRSFCAHREVKIAIFGIEGGIGTGKTLTLVHLGIEDLMAGKKIYSNVTLKKIPAQLKPNIRYLTKDEMNDIFKLVKEKKFDMRNSTVLIQEAHNYLDARSSMLTRNKMLTYWILQSRHTGQGSCDIIYDTQDFIQVDKRLRQNTDFKIHPQIIEWEFSKPTKIALLFAGKVGHTIRRFTQVIDVSQTRNMYDTHELVDF